jgi:hypothetical protein
MDLDLSIVIPISNDYPLAIQQVGEIQSFYAKFGLKVEVVLVLTNTNDPQKNKLPPDSTNSFTVKIIGPVKKQSRASAVMLGISHASGKLIAVSSSEASTPLTSYYSAVVGFLSQPTLDLVIGNRNDAKYPVLGTIQQAKKQRELEHSKYFREMFNLEHNDVISPFVVLKKESAQKLMLERLRGLKGWYYTPFLLQECKIHDLSVLEIPIQRVESGRSLYRPFWDGLHTFMQATLRKR